MKIYWVKQLFIITFLFILALVIDMYMKNSLFSIDKNILKQTILLVIIAVILFACNQLLYNFAKINSKFMQHSIWNKMYIVILILLLISFSMFIILFTVTPFSNLLQNQIWIMYIIVYYFLFFINLLMLSIIHILVPREVKVERKIMLTWITSTLSIALIIFFIPSF